MMILLYIQHPGTVRRDSEIVIELRWNSMEVWKHGSMEAWKHGSGRDEIFVD
jgi:hypothetical protein